MCYVSFVLHVLQIFIQQHRILLLDNLWYIAIDENVFLMLHILMNSYVINDIPFSDHHDLDNDLNYDLLWYWLHKSVT